MEKFSSEPETNSMCSETSEISTISDYRPQHKSRKTKQVRCKRFKYQNITNDLRAVLIKKVIEEKQKIKPMARKLGINYSTAKSILQIYRKEGRTDKKLIPRGTSQLESTEQNEISTVAPKAHDLSLNIESESKMAEQHRYSLRKRDPVPKEDPLLSCSKKPDLTAVEPRKIKKVRMVQGHGVKIDRMELEDKNASQQDGLVSEHTASQSSNENSGKGVPMFDVKTEEILQKQASLLLAAAPKSFELREPTALSSEIQRRNLLLQAMMPLLAQQLSPANLVGLNLCGLINPSVQQQNSKILMFATNSQQNTQVRVPLFFNPHPAPSFLFKSHPLDFNSRVNFKK